MKLILAILTFTLALSATPITMQFNGVATSTNDGQYYVGLYNFNLAGVPIQTVCLDLLHSIYGGQTWTVNVLTDADLGPTDRLNMETAAVIAYGTFHSPTDQWALNQHAIWESLGQREYGSSAVDAKIAWARAQVSGFDFSTVRFYMPTGSTGQAQVGFVPEPGAFGMIGFGLIGVSVLLRWKRKGA